MNVWALLVLFCAWTPGDELADLAAAGEWGQLEETASALLSSAPDNELALYWRGRARLARAQELLSGSGLARDLGRALLSRALEDLQRVPLAGDAPVDAREWWLLSRWEEARADPSAGTEVAEDLERAASEGWEYAAYLRGLLAREEGRDELALTWLERAASAEMPRSEYGLALAETLAAAGRRGESIPAWRSAASTPDAELGALLDTLGRLLPARQDAQERLALFDRLAARSAWRDDRRLVWHRAAAFADLGRWGDAATTFASAGSGGDAGFDRAWAVVLLRLGRLEEAIAVLRPWVQERDWEAWMALLDVADACALARAWGPALLAYEAVLAMEARDERGSRNQALTFTRAGRLREAREAWGRLLTLFPNRMDVLNDAALAAWAEGDRERARRLLEEACELPGANDARENLAGMLLAGSPSDPAAALGLLDEVLINEPARQRALWLRTQARRCR